MTRILVTGIGGDLGHGIGKILRRSGVAQFLVGCDVHDEHAGTMFFDRCEIVGRADSPDFLESLLRIAKANRVDMIVPTAEPELRFISKAGLSGSLEGIPLVMANEKALRVGFDKLETANFLKANGLPFPWTKMVIEGPPERYPCLIKERFGAGSKGVAIVQPAKVDLYRQERANDIWQEYLEPSVSEYTCGIYRTGSDQVRTITFWRKLSGGHTGYGRVVSDKPEIDSLLVSVARAIGLRGSINAQLILTARGPVIFEINPRFSSTVVFRHLLGFQDVIWSIQERLGEPISGYVAPRNGTAFYRGADELILPNGIEQQ